MRCDKILSQEISVFGHNRNIHGLIAVLTFAWNGDK